MKHTMTPDMVEIEAWVKDEKPGHTFRRVEITSHCHGVRVTLHEHSEEITSYVGDHIAEAFRGCLSYYSQARKNKYKERLDQLRKWLADDENNASHRKSEIERLEEEMKT